MTTSVAATMKRMCSHRKEKKKRVVKWVKKQFPPANTDCTFAPDLGCTVLEPLEYFVKYFPDEIFIYALQRRSWAQCHIGRNQSFLSNYDPHGHFEIPENPNVLEGRHKNSVHCGCDDIQTILQTSSSTTRHWRQRYVGSTKKQVLESGTHHWCCQKSLSCFRASYRKQHWWTDGALHGEDPR